MNKTKAQPAWGGWYTMTLVSTLALVGSTSGAGILEMRNGYFWDPAEEDYFIPRGIAYQTWNPPVGADQSLAQVEYDLVEFKKMYANSVRAEFVWNQVEPAPGTWDWSKPDYLVAKAEELGLRLFVLIGFQYAPDWFPDEWKAINNEGKTSVVLNYEHPEVRRVYSNYIYQVVGRYRDSTAIGGWILGNEYAYFDLWEPEHRFLGYDPVSQASFRNHLAAVYGGDIAQLNTNWGTAYPNFDAVEMPPAYPFDRNLPAYHDLIQWRKKSIGDYVAVGAQAARQADPRHLLTYSMVGGIFSGNDALNTGEDAHSIVARCVAAGAPLDFWSINNYAWALVGSELRTGDYGIAKYQAQSGLPVMISETGHSSTEDLLPGAAERQPKALPGQLWEALVSGAIGVHLFHWNDRNQFRGFFVREKGFGIVNQDRTLKTPVYWNVLEVYRRMENLNIGRLLGGSANPAPDVQFFWSQSADMGWNRANMENAMLWGALKRLGYQPGFLDDAQYERGDYTNAPALLLSRCYQMQPDHLEFLATRVIPAGIHLHANADLPGQFNAYHQPNPDWAAQMSNLFGLDVTSARPGWDSGVTNLAYTDFKATATSALGPFTPGTMQAMTSWKIWHQVAASAGTTILTHRGRQNSQAPMPALQIRDLGGAKTAINTFGLGDVDILGASLPPTDHWNIHTDWLRAIYRDHFGIVPRIELSGAGYVISDYRLCPNGSCLVSLLNEHTNSASVTLAAPGLLAGKIVENLTTGGIVETNSNGQLTLDLGGDDYVLLYCYSPFGGPSPSLINPYRTKLWIDSAPLAVWPNGSNWNLTIGYDTGEVEGKLRVSFEEEWATNSIYAEAPTAVVSGQGSRVVSLAIPDADLGDPDYRSSREGGAYVFRAWLEHDGVRTGESVLPVRLLWGVRPVAVPPEVLPGNEYPVTVEWQELPSYLPSEVPLPLSRAALWQPYTASRQYYKVVLELRRGDQVVVAQEYLTNTGTDQHTFTVRVPDDATGPFTWSAYLQAAPEASMDLLDGFEDRDTGAESTLFAPWQSYVYSQLNNAQSLAEGVDTHAREGKRAMFLVVTNPPDPGSFSGFGLRYVYPRLWALSPDWREGPAYTFSCDFREALSQPCEFELQVIDVRGGQIHYTKSYTPGSNGWDRVQASLDQFVVPPWVGYFDSTKVSELVLNVQMFRTATIFHGSFDNIQFNGPERSAVQNPVHDVWEGFDEREGGDDPSVLWPWVTYVYSELGNATWLSQGINSQAANGGHAAFMVVTNPPDSGTFAGFGMYYLFPSPWGLPAVSETWTNYNFSFDFKESSARRCVLEMQVKSGPNSWIGFTNAFLPRPDGWARIMAPLSQFVPAEGEEAFDPAHIEAVAVNIRMLEPGQLYQGVFDNIFFNAPDQVEDPGPYAALYVDGNDSLRIQSIRVNATGGLLISWLPTGILQSAPELAGEWSDVTGPTNRYQSSPAELRRFYRVRRSGNP